jgi:protein TonB
MVVMNCVAHADGSLAPCSIVSEVPAGQGFADATLQLKDKFRLAPQQADGSPIEDRRINLRLRFETE